MRRAIHRAAGQMPTESAASLAGAAATESQVLHLDTSNEAEPDHCTACFVTAPAQGGAR